MTNQTTDDNGSPPRILLAEDDPSIASLYTQLLRAKGYQVVAARCGLDVLELWESGSFDLILMDLKMPKMDGFETARTIRDREGQSSAHTPIIAMSAHVNSEDKARCLEAGMDDYISKLIDTASFHKVILKYLPGPADPTQGI